MKPSLTDHRTIARHDRCHPAFLGTGNLRRYPAEFGGRLMVKARALLQEIA